MDPFMIVMLVGMLGLMFFMQSRARKQNAAREAFRTQLQPGQRVMTQGGLVGTIISVDDAADTVILESAGSRCEYMRAGLAKTLDAVPVGSSAAVSTLAPTSAPAPGGLLANALGNLTGAVETGPQIDDADFAELDNISREYHESQIVETPTTHLPKPVVIVEEE